MRDRVCPVLSELMLQGARAECEQARVKLAAEYDIEGIRSVAEGCPVGVMLWQARRDAATATRRADALESLLTTVAEAMQGVEFAGIRDTIVSALEAVDRLAPRTEVEDA